jgi:hypothetical protein
VNFVWLVIMLRPVIDGASCSSSADLVFLSLFCYEDVSDLVHVVCVMWALIYTDMLVDH